MNNRQEMPDTIYIREEGCNQFIADDIQTMGLYTKKKPEKGNYHTYVKAVTCTFNLDDLIRESILKSMTMTNDLMQEIKHVDTQDEFDELIRQSYMVVNNKEILDFLDSSVPYKEWSLTFEQRDHINYITGQYMITVIDLDNIGKGPLELELKAFFQQNNIRPSY